MGKAFCRFKATGYMLARTEEREIKGIAESGGHRLYDKAVLGRS